MPHPVRWIGKLIEKTEKTLRNTSLPEKFSGWILALSVVFIVLFSASYTLFLVKKISSILSYALEIWMIFTAVSLKSLRQESIKIKKHLENNDLPEARKALSMIVGRDTEDLMEDDITRATVETVAENFVDGVLSPLLFTFDTCIQGNQHLGFDGGI
jgi:adenosylcobinamide-phosphate synthase